jgi:hypothetical protein
LGLLTVMGRRMIAKLKNQVDSACWS